MTYSILRLLFFIKSSILLQTNLLKHIEGQFLSNTHFIGHPCDFLLRFRFSLE